jgi:hypothetical protein
LRNRGAGNSAILNKGIEKHQVEIAPNKNRVREFRTKTDQTVNHPFAVIAPVNVITKKYEAVFVRGGNGIEQPVELIPFAVYIADGD